MFFVITWTARYLGPVDFGVYSFTVASVLLVATLGNLGLAGIVTHDLVEDPVNSTTILGTAFGLRLVGAIGTVGILAVFVLVVPLPDSRAQWLIVLLACGHLFRPTAVVESFYEARVQGRFAVIARIVAAAALLGMTAFLIRSSAPVGWFVAARATELALGGIALVTVLALHRPRALTWRFDREVAAGMLRRSWPLLASALTATIYLKIDQIMIGAMLGAQEVGIYSAASQLSEVWYFLPTILMSSLFPSLISVRQRSGREYEERLGSIFRILGWSGIALAALVALWAAWLVNAFFGTGYGESAAILRIHVWAMPFIFMRAALSKWIIIEHAYTVSLTTHGAGAIANVTMNLILIPKFGPMGAATATIASYAVASYLSLFVTRRTRDVARLMTISLATPHRIIGSLIHRRS